MRPQRWGSSLCHRRCHQFQEEKYHRLCLLFYSIFVKHGECKLNFLFWFESGMKQEQSKLSCRLSWPMSSIEIDRRIRHGRLTFMGGTNCLASTLRRVNNTECRGIGETTTGNVTLRSIFRRPWYTGTEAENAPKTIPESKSPWKSPRERTLDLYRLFMQQ